MKIKTAAPMVHVWEKRRPDKTTVRIEVEIGTDSTFRGRAEFRLRVGWRPFRGRSFRFPGDPLLGRQGKEDERNAIVFAIVTPDEIREACEGLISKIADLKIPEPVAPSDLRA